MAALIDLLHALATPAPLAHRRLGYVRDAVRMASRARRCRAAWAPHLEATRAAIRAAIAGTAERRTAVVLGSGLLDDVPLDALADAFARIVLVDAVHPLRARAAARRHAHVERMTADLSGSFALLGGAAADLAPGLPAVCAAPETDLVVSVNLLSQLPIRPVRRLEASRRPLGRWRPEQADLLGARIVARHLASLSALPARVCLVTDLDEVEEDREGRVRGRTDLLFGTRLPEPERSWTWEIAPFGEVSRRSRLLHRVAAFPDWRG